MKIGGGGSEDVNLLQSDNVTLRNLDAVTSNGFAFIFGGWLDSTAGEYSHVQVMNPTGSGKVVFIDQYSIASAANSQVRTGFFDTELTTDLGAFVNKLAGGSAASAHLRIQRDSSALGTSYQTVWLLQYSTFPFMLTPPVELAAGKGFILELTTANTAGICSFQIREYTA